MICYGRSNDYAVYPTQGHLQSPICHLCGQRPALIGCYQERSKLCYQCFVQHQICVPSLHTVGVIPFSSHTVSHSCHEYVFYNTLLLTIGFLQQVCLHQRETHGSRGPGAGESGQGGGRGHDRDGGGGRGGSKRPRIVAPGKPQLLQLLDKPGPSQPHRQAGIMDLALAALEEHIISSVSLFSYA